VGCQFHQRVYGDLDDGAICKPIRTREGSTACCTSAKSLNEGYDRLHGRHAHLAAAALPPGVQYVVGSSLVELAPTPENRQGFGLGFMVRNQAGGATVPGSVGTYLWIGTFGTIFWIDPAAKLIALQMQQVAAGTGGLCRHLVYLALSNAAN
jgi:hypothetical protein